MKITTSESFKTSNLTRKDIELRVSHNTRAARGLPQSLAIALIKLSRSSSLPTIYVIEQFARVFIILIKIFQCSSIQYNMKIKGSNYKHFMYLPTSIIMDR